MKTTHPNLVSRVPTKSPILSGSAARSLFAALAIGGLAVSTASAVIIDGVVSAGEYTNVTSVSFVEQDSGTLVPEPGQLYWSVDATSGNVSAAFVMPLSLNDNTYGTESIGWGKKGHTFSSLLNSDSGQFNFTDANGNLALSFTMDYFSLDKSTGLYDSLGVTGGDGSMLKGSTSSVISASTSLDYNFNVLGYSSYTTNSPSTTFSLIPGTNSVDYSAGYGDSSEASGWVYNMIYEVEIDGSVFGAAGFGSVSFPGAHNSPTKLGISVAPPPPTPIPEPGTVLPLAAMLGMLAFSRRSLRVVQA